MIQFHKIPFILWLIKTIKSNILEYKHRQKHLKIGNLSHLTNCSFSLYNTIYDNVSLKNVILGDLTYISKGTRIMNATIGKFCSIGPDCKIGLGKHPTKDYVSTHPIFFSTLKQSQITFCKENEFDEYENITIGNDVWLGSNVIVTDGVSIGDGAIIAAGSVVTKDVSPYTIMGGIPAEMIRFRFKNEEIEKLSKLKWWNMDIEYLKINAKKFKNLKKFLNHHSKIN
jgi:acetyltransferase-like isoleucine patch superfamily enzyme